MSGIIAYPIAYAKSPTIVLGIQEAAMKQFDECSYN
jgi:hypothetical protein